MAKENRVSLTDPIVVMHEIEDKKFQPEISLGDVTTFHQQFEEVLVQCEYRIPETIEMMIWERIPAGYADIQQIVGDNKMIVAGLWQFGEIAIFCNRSSAARETPSTKTWIMRRNPIKEQGAEHITIQPLKDGYQLEPTQSVIHNPKPHNTMLFALKDK